MATMSKTVEIETPFLKVAREFRASPVALVSLIVLLSLIMLE